MGRLSDWVLGKDLVLVFLILINMAGFLVGLSHYLDEFATHPPFLWPVVADCPVAVLLFSGICILYLFRRRVPDLLVFFTSAYMIKYGIWTISAIFLYWGWYATPWDQVMGVINFVLHCGLVLEGLLLAGRTNRSFHNAVIVSAVLVTSDVFDYLLGTLPNIPLSHVGTLMAESILVSLALPFVIYFSVRKDPSTKPLP